MSNWFENNQTKSVLLYTLFIIGATWAFYRFIFEEKKIDFYKAQVETSQVEIEHYKARIDFLEKESVRLESILQEFEDWNAKSTNPILFYKNQYESLIESKTKYEDFFSQHKEYLDTISETPHKPTSNIQTPQSIDQTIDKGKSYINDSDEITISVNEIHVDGTCTFTISVGQIVNQLQKEVKTGNSFKYGSKPRIKITLVETNYITSTAKFHIVKH